MAFLKTKVAKGRYYYALAESYRDDLGKPRQKILVNLGAARKAIEYLNCSDNELTVKEYIQFLKKIATDSIFCKKCGSADVYWTPVTFNWDRYGCNSCH